jgi:predicted PurR-regulated permease PerM
VRAVAGGDGQNGAMGHAGAGSPPESSGVRTVTEIEVVRASTEVELTTAAAGGPARDEALPGAAAEGVGEEAGSGWAARRGRLLRPLTARRVPTATIVVTVAVVVAVYLAGKLLYRLRDIVLLMVLGGFITLLLDPLVVTLQRRVVHRRGYAVAIVTLLAIVAFIALGFAFGYPLVHGLTHLAESLPKDVKQAEQGHGWIGHLVKRYHVESWVQRNSPKLISFAEGLTKPVLSVGKGAVSVLLSLVALFIFVLLLLLEAPKLRAGILSVMSPHAAARWERLGGDITRSVSGYMAGNLATSLIAGVVVFVTLTLLDVPFALLWALWVALVDFLPMVGGAIAGIPTVLFAFTHSVVAGIVTAVVFIVYTQVENHILNPIVMSRTVRINPLLVFVSVIVAAGIGSWVGGIFGGFAAALIAIPAAGAAQAVFKEVWRSTADPAPGTGGAPGPPRALDAAGGRGAAGAGGTAGPTGTG